jgi:hypothetical protein
MTVQELYLIFQLFPGSLSDWSWKREVKIKKVGKAVFAFRLPLPLLFLLSLNLKGE